TMSESGRSCRCDCICCKKLHNCCFPCNCLAPCCKCLPQSLCSIQDWLHLVLLLGVLTTAVFTAFSIYVVAASETCSSPFCIRQVVALLVAIPSNYMFVQFIREYDQGSLADHMQTAQQAVQDLVKGYDAEVKEMRKVIDDLTGTAAAFAMSCFTTSREEFEKFLIGTKYYHTDLYVDPTVHQQFKQFVRKWLDIYAQSLLDPDPLRDGLDASLASCITVEATCDEILARLANTRMSTLQQRSRELNEQCIAGQEFVQDALCLLDHREISVASSSFMLSDDPSRKCGISWLRCGCTSLGLLVERTRDRDFVSEWPQTFGFCCFSVTVLSGRHQLFLFLLFFNVLMIVYEAIAERPWLMGVFIANEVCVLAILICFEQIDEIAKLQRQQQRYRERRERLAAKAKSAREDWMKVQRLFDLWNYRTQPFLRIMGKLHRTLEGMDRDACMPRLKDVEARRPSTVAHEAQRLQWLQETNERIGELDARLEGVEWASE
ncbi:nek8, partial [Symbiodinium necroappetens]